MLLLLKLKAILLKHFMDLKWYSVVASIIVFVFASWALLWACGESEIVKPSNFFYWLVVTGSTVGYGDFSPATSAGKIVTAFFIIPFGLALFAFAVGQIATYFSLRWRRGIQGLKTLDFENHVLVIGWAGPRTVTLLKLLLREQTHSHVGKNVALCVVADIENPMPGEIGFIKVQSFTDAQEMSRSGIEHASSIIISNIDDDVTLTTALFCGSANPNAHIIAHFSDEGRVRLLKQHCPNIECTPSVSVEMMAKSAADPGSSQLHHQLLNVDVGITQYSIRYQGNKPIQIKDLFASFKEKYAATLIGIAKADNNQMELNPDLALTIKPGATIYYIADERISGINWEQFNV